MDSDKQSTGSSNQENSSGKYSLHENLQAILEEIVEVLPYLKEFKSFFDTGKSINDPGGGLINSATLKRILGVSDRTLSRWRSSKMIPYQQCGSDCYYSYDELSRYFSRTNVILGRGITGAEALARLRSFKMGLAFQSSAVSSQYRELMKNNTRKYYPITKTSYQ